jgi:hypothetical protein
MSEAEDDAPIDRALIDAARPGLGPTEVQRARLKKSVLAAAAASAAAGGAAAASGTGVSTTAGVGMGAKVAVSLIGLVAIGGGMWLATRPPERPTAVVEAPQVVVAPPVQVTPPVVEAPVVQAPVVEAPVVVAPVVEAPVEAPAEAPTPAEPPHADPRIFASIEQETELIREAHMALRSGDAGRAMTLLEAHEAQAPRGALATERRVLRILCLCELGSEDRARIEAQRFLATNPSATLVARIEASCVGALE